MPPTCVFNGLIEISPQRRKSRLLSSTLILTKPQNGLRVEVKNNNVEFALKKFKKMVKNSDLMLELKKRTYYEKPSKKRRETKQLIRIVHMFKLTSHNENNIKIQ